MTYRLTSATPSSWLVYSEGARIRRRARACVFSRTSYMYEPFSSKSPRNGSRGTRFIVAPTKNTRAEFGSVFSTNEYAVVKSRGGHERRRISSGECRVEAPLCLASAKGDHLERQTTSFAPLRRLQSHTSFITRDYWPNLHLFSMHLGKLYLLPKNVHSTYD